MKKRHVNYDLHRRKAESGNGGEGLEQVTQDVDHRDVHNRLELSYCQRRYSLEPFKIELICLKRIKLNITANHDCERYKK